jgi:20S proteasome alpha/beta subunit
MKPNLNVKPLPRPKPKRLTGRKAVTVIAGFKCSQGIILCADTQETVSNISKRSVPKLRFEPAGAHQGDELAAAFCGAGDNGPFIDKLVDTAWEDVQGATSIDEACSDIEKSIKRTYLEFGQIYQAGYCPSAEIIYGVKMHGSCRLFSAHGPVVNEKEEYDACGAGYYMADFLKKRMYSPSLNIRQCAILAAYVIFQAKEHVDGCGGDTHIAVLRKDGVSGVAQKDNVDAMTEMADCADGSFGRMLLQAADLDLTADEFTKPAHEEIEILETLRDAQQSKLQKAGIWALRRILHPEQYAAETDFLGLPMPTKDKP